jgi:hypothetical protein
MSKLFFDQLVVLDDVESEIKKTAKTPEEREELWGLVDEIVHHRVLDCVFDRLPKKSHQEFLEKYHSAPFDEELVGYLKKEIGENVEEIIKTEIGGLAFELLEEIRGKEALGLEPSEKKK